MNNYKNRYTITRKELQEIMQELIRSANATILDNEEVIIPGTNVRIASGLIKKDEELDKTLLSALQFFHKKPIEIVD